MYMLADIASYFIILSLLSWYFITTLQWYSYRPKRAVFHHTKIWWNYIYFFIPFLTYDFVSAVAERYSFVVTLLYIPLFYRWYGSTDKRLVLTARVKRFFAAVLFFAVFLLLLLHRHFILIPIILGWFASVAVEKILFGAYARRASLKLEKMKELVVVGVTASYGKTSMKNFIAAILSVKYDVYATPRSVNTLAGVIKDINEDLPEKTQIYIVEMGARGEGDIAEISRFVKPHYAVVGRIGPAHIEYFGTLEKIRDTKMEILESPRLREAWIDESAMVKGSENIHSFGSEIEDIKANLDGISFRIGDREYKAPLLGAFNAHNLTAAILLARALGLSEEEIAEGMKRVEAVEHRLQRIDAGGKIILDDSFNGNIDGMRASFELASLHDGRKIVVTPGLVESDRESNEEVAKMANGIFDLVIVTGELNYPIFESFVDSEKLIHLRDKSGLEALLAEKTSAGDLILFANDAPSYI